MMYKVVNSETDPEGDHYNAFHMPRGNGLTLAAVKQHCSALHALNHIGPDGFHWRVCVEDKPVAGSSSKSFSWWDIQDDKASLPVKSATPSELRKLFTGTSPQSDGGGGHNDSPRFAAKSALKGFGKAMTAVAGAVDGGHRAEDHGPRLSVIAFKLLDLVKMHDDFVRIHGGSSRGGHHHHVASNAPKAAPKAARSAVPASTAPQRRPAPTPTRSAAPQQARAPARTPVPSRAPQAATQPSVPVRPPPRQQQPEASLMDFDSPRGGGQKTANLMHAQSLPATFNNETRVERLKREYAQNEMQQNRVWDEVDQRWVAVETNGSPVKQATTSAPPSAMNSSGSLGTKVVGIKLDASNAVGKSASVQAAVHKRVNDMKVSQDKALAEVREREEKKKKEDEEEDAARKRLEPKIKAWSEEHGKKKQLRALLGTLHTILWPGAGWQPIGLGDLLDDGKVKRAFHKASRVVHPDKTHHLGPEERFLAKRIFDALSQAKTEFDEGK